MRSKQRLQKRSCRLLQDDRTQISNDISRASNGLQECCLQLKDISEIRKHFKMHHVNNSRFSCSFCSYKMTAEGSTAHYRNKFKNAVVAHVEAHLVSNERGYYSTPNSRNKFKANLKATDVTAANTSFTTRVHLDRGHNIAKVGNFISCCGKAEIFFEVDKNAVRITNLEIISLKRRKMRGRRGYSVFSRVKKCFSKINGERSRKIKRQHYDSSLALGMQNSSSSEISENQNGSSTFHTADSNEYSQLQHMPMTMGMPLIPYNSSSRQGFSYDQYRPISYGRDSNAVGYSPYSNISGYIGYGGLQYPPFYNNNGENLHGYSNSTNYLLYAQPASYTVQKTALEAQNLDNHLSPHANSFSAFQRPCFILTNSDSAPAETEEQM